MQEVRQARASVAGKLLRSVANQWHPCLGFFIKRHGVVDVCANGRKPAHLENFVLFYSHFILRDNIAVKGAQIYYCNSNIYCNFWA